MDDFLKVCIWFMVGSGTLFVVGFRGLHQKRMIENIPTSKIRSAAMGQVELSGHATSRQDSVRSPIQGVPCAWWNCVVEEYKSSGRRGSWYPLRHFQHPDVFVLTDETGSVWVDTAGAELGFSTNIYYRDGMFEDTSYSSQVQSFLDEHGLDPTNFLGMRRKVRVCETVIPQNAQVYILGFLKTFSMAGEASSKRQEFNVHLRALKEDKKAMAAADSNQDGQIDDMEWQAFVANERKAFYAGQAPEAEPERRNVIGDDPSGPFIVSPESESGLVGNNDFMASIGLIFGILLSICWFMACIGLYDRPLWTAVATIIPGPILGFLCSSDKLPSGWRVKRS